MYEQQSEDSSPKQTLGAIQGAGLVGTTAKASPLVRALDSQERAINELHKTIEILTGKLLPILRSEDPQKGVGEEVEPSESDIVREIQNKTHSIVSASSKLAEIIDRVTI